MAFKGSLLLMLLMLLMLLAPTVKSLPLSGGSLGSPSGRVVDGAEAVSAQHNKCDSDCLNTFVNVGAYIQYNGLTQNTLHMRSELFISMIEITRFHKLLLASFKARSYPTKKHHISNYYKLPQYLGEIFRDRSDSFGLPNIIVLKKLRQKQLGLTTLSHTKDIFERCKKTRFPVKAIF